MQGGETILIYSVYVEVFPNYDVLDWDYCTMENVISKEKLPYDEVVKIALNNALKDLEEIYGVSENIVKHTKAIVVGAIENESFKD